MDSQQAGIQHPLTSPAGKLAGKASRHLDFPPASSNGQGTRFRLKLQLEPSVSPRSRDGPANSGKGLAGIEINWQVCMGEH